MYVLKTIVNRGWCPILITALAVVGYIYEWPSVAVVPALSIFAIIDSLFNVEDSKLWDWARACDMSQRIFNTWCDSFIGRVESDARTGRFDVYVRTYLNELWLANSHYYEFVEQFYEVTQKVELPQETIDQYNKFVVEYNAFVQHFRDNITELRKFAKTEIEAPSVKFANELSGLK